MTERDCMTKGDVTVMDEQEKQVNSVPYIAFEGEQARAERHIKRLWIAFIITVVLMFVSNVAWLVYISQYDFESYAYTQDGQGVNVIGNENGVGQYGTKIDGEEKKP